MAKLMVIKFIIDKEPADGFKQMLWPLANLIYSNDYSYFRMFQFKITDFSRADSLEGKDPEEIQAELKEEVSSLVHPLILSLKPKEDISEILYYLKGENYKDKQNLEVVSKTNGVSSSLGEVLIRLQATDTNNKLDANQLLQTQWMRHYLPSYTQNGCNFQVETDI